MAATRKKVLCCNEINNIRAKYAEIERSGVVITKFENFPLSTNTLRGLKDARYTSPTEIQCLGIVHALQGRDVVGSAITGSGKTLAFLIPVLEHLYLNKWTSIDGLGAIIISPTRELAYQTFEMLKKVGKYHDFSAGLIIGGKNLKFERARMDKCNILICTPGRLLQHMDENPLFTTTNMEILVLDEADRCLDLGFQKTLNAIIENFVPTIQTLLFSATQTNSIKDLARLSLKNPFYIGTKESNIVVPEMLQQSYVVVALEDKLTMLWSFIKNHLKQKCIVFVASCKQVKYIYEIFCKLRPGTSLLALYGTLHQDRRLQIYNQFINKKNVVLFATDIASRGLDFPSVHWVVQLDCPEDGTQYVHRAGRCARNKESGESLLVLLPTEKDPMLQELENLSLFVKEIQIDPKKLFSPRAKIEAFLAQIPELKATAKRAYMSYIKSVYSMKNKNIFSVHNLDFDAFAKSLGLAVTPRVRFLNHMAPKDLQKKIEGFENYKHVKGGQSEIDVSGSDSEDLFTVKSANYNHGHDDSAEPNILIHQKKKKLITKAKQAKKYLKKNILLNKRHKFGEDESEIQNLKNKMEYEQFKAFEKERNFGGINIEVSKEFILAEDKFDKKRFKDMIKIKHKNNKSKMKEKPQDECIFEDNGSLDLSLLPIPDVLYSAGKNVNKTIFSQGNKRTHESQINTKAHLKYTKKRKHSPKLSLNDAEVIASEILFDS